MINWDKLRENYTLEDFCYLLDRNKPHRNSKLYKEWVLLVNEAYHELAYENENYNECERIIDEIIDFLKRQKEICMKGMIYYD